MKYTRCVCVCFDGQVSLARCDMDQSRTKIKNPWKRRRRVMCEFFFLQELYPPPYSVYKKRRSFFLSFFSTIPFTQFTHCRHGRREKHYSQSAISLPGSPPPPWFHSIHNTVGRIQSMRCVYIYKQPRWDEVFTPSFISFGFNGISSPWRVEREEAHIFLLFILRSQSFFP